MRTNLDINSFTANGKNYRVSDAVNLSDAENFLKEKGYGVKSISQPWRNVFARLESEGKEFFFKLASTPWVWERLKNEVSWNTRINRILDSSESGGKFLVPRIMQSGEWNGLPYYVGEFFPGSFINGKNPEDCQVLDDWLEKIVACNLFFLSLSENSLSLYRDKDFLNLADAMDSLLKRIQSWADQVPERDFSRLMDMVGSLKNGFVSGVNHGDFVPWHMIVQDDQFVLIDGEHGSSKNLRYYDIAYFYHRVYTVLRNPTIAKKYLRMLIDRLSSKEKALFELQFPKVLASRIIGGYFDAKHDGTNFEMHDRMKEEFLNGS